MAENSWPSPTYNSRNVTESEYEAINARATDDGVNGDPTGAPVVTAGTGMQVLVKAGAAGCVRGFAWQAGTTDVPLTIAANSSGSTRVDWVALRLDRATWNVRAAIVQGTPGSGAPALTQDTNGTGVFEIPLAYVTVPNGASSVTVTPYAQYIGARIRPRLSTQAAAFPRRGEMAFETDTGRWRGWNGTGFVTLYEDTGDLALGAGYDTWAISGSTGRKKSSTVTVTLNAKRITSTFSSSDTDGSKIAVLPASLRPPSTVCFAGKFTAGNVTSGATCRVEVRTNGEVWCRYLSSNVPVNYYLYLTLTYLV